MEINTFNFKYIDMKTTVSLIGLEFHAFHGYYEEERKAGNNFIIDTEVDLKSFDSEDDNILDTVNYEQMYTICKEEMQRTQKLLETVVMNILGRYKVEFKHAVGARVTMKKVGPQLGGKVEMACVSMEY